MSDQDRIRLAEAMGWKWVRLGTEYAWKRPDGRIVGIFNPYTDANDCDALIRKLNEQGFSLIFYRWPVNTAIELRKDVSRNHHGDYRELAIGHWTGDDYKQGVCELALKALDDG